MPTITSTKAADLAKSTELEQLADELYQLKQEYDNAELALKMAKVRARDLVDLGPNGKQAEALTATAWLTIKRSGRYSAPTEAELEAIGPELAARLFRKTKKVKPNARANWKAFLKKCAEAGIETDGYLEATETTQAVKDFGAAVEYELDEEPEQAEALTACVARITGAPVVTIRPADLRPEPKND